MRTDERTKRYLDLLRGAYWENYSAVFSAVGHMQNLQDLDTRAIHVDLGLQHNNPNELLAPLARMICQSVVCQAFPEGEERPGIIFRDDLSRANMPCALNGQRRISALVILPKPICVHECTLREYAHHLDFDLNTGLKLWEMKDASARPYDYRDQLGSTPVLHANGWSNLLARDPARGQVIKPIEKSVYPTFFDRDAADTPLSDSDAMHRILKDSPRALFSERYVSKFGIYMRNRLPCYSIDELDALVNGGFLTEGYDTGSLRKIAQMSSAEASM